MSRLGASIAQAAIKAWVKITARIENAPIADVGTVAELI
jgi:hypothetical protein